MAAFQDITGRRFGRLIVQSLSHSHQYPSGTTSLYWKCVCDCGNVTTVKGQSLRKGHTQSCGCLSRQRLAEHRNKHGMWASKEYWAWALAKNRCTNPRHSSYRNYGGRGIKMCDEWAVSFEQFYRDMGPCPANLSLDRINNDGHYEKSNCRWTTATIQARNTRITAKIIYKDEYLSFAELAEKTGIGVNTLRGRYHRGWRPPRLFEPTQTKFSHARSL